MKNILYDNEDFLPITVITTSIAIMNFGVCFLGTFSTMFLVVLAFFHILVNFKLKYLKYVPIVKIIKYSILCLLWNSITYFIAVYFKINILATALNLVVDNFIQVGSKLAIMCLVFLGIFSNLAKKTDNKKTIERKYEKYAPQITIFIFLICNTIMLILTKNLFDMIIGILVVVPYIWYVFSLLSKWGSVIINIPRTSDIQL